MFVDRKLGIEPSINCWENSAEPTWLKIFKLAAKKSKGRARIEVCGDLDTSNFPEELKRSLRDRKIYRVTLSEGFGMRDFHRLQEPYIEKFIRRKKS